jgi:hypothetical protein
VRADPRSPARSTLDEVFDLAAYTRHVDVGLRALRALSDERRRPCMSRCTSRRARCARSTRSTTRALLVASDRISTFDVVLPTPIPTRGAC